jgi:sec-independent protein translocase protein TatA
MFSFSMPELALILVIALVVFGPGKLPEVGKALGKGIQEFRRATTGEPAKEEPIQIQPIKTETIKQDAPVVAPVSEGTKPEDKK